MSTGFAELRDAGLNDAAGLTRYRRPAVTPMCGGSPMPARPPVHRSQPQAPCQRPGWDHWCRVSAVRSSPGLLRRARPSS